MRGHHLLEPALKPFLDDLVSVLLGRECAKVEPLELKDVGAISVEMFPLVPLMLYSYRDPFDGAVDLELIQRFTSRATRGSLIVIEELENFKHPTLLIDLVREVARKAVERDLTLVATTHSDLVLHAVGRAVEDGVVKPERVAVYYLERSKEMPWTGARRIQVYEDGTFAEIPHVEEVLAHVF